VIVVDPGHNGANAAHLADINAPVDAGGFEKACNTTGTANSRMSESQANLALGLELAAQLRARGATVVLTRDTDEGWGPCIDARGRLAGEVGADLLVSLHADGAPRAQHGFHVIHPVRDRLTGAGFTPSTYVGRDGLDQRSDLGTLNQARVPAIMIEVGNMANDDDAAMIASPERRRQLAGAITAGIADTLAP
jgi:N-acetylmuramoyl-L-alanine amidase